MRKPIKIALGVAMLATAGAVAYAAAKPRIVAMPAAEAARHTAWDFRLTAIDGEPMPMARYRGNVVLLVNTASFCGFTPQYEGLQALQTAYSAKRFTVLGVPSGNFMSQEYGKNAEIAGFCKSKFGVRFPLAEKSDVVGEKTIPIYRWAAARLGARNAPQWNFHKYLIGRDGRLIAAFGSKTAPQDPLIRSAIEKALAAPGA
jgi:glutathione peroxidase